MEATMSEDTLKITDEDIEKQESTPTIQITGLDIMTDEGEIGKPAQPIPWDVIGQSSSKEPIDIILLIDTSGSMAATDYVPDRLTAAKEAATLFTKRKVVQNYNDRVAVIGFGGFATTVHPLDSNLEKVAASIGNLVITHTGTMIGTGLQAAAKELKGQNSKRQAIVLLSDGGDSYDTSRPVEIAQSLKGIKVFTIGMGTVKGAKVKLPHGEQQVMLNEQLLQQVSKITGGEYLYAPDAERLRSVYATLADY
jgi:Ca-activated chloride channel family protein